MVAVFSVLVSALVWAMVGVLTWWAVSFTAALIGWIITRALPPSLHVAGRPTPAWYWWMLLVVVGAWSVWQGATASELVITGRDGATYLNIAKGLESGGPLLPEVVLAPFDTPEDVSFESPGWVLRDDGRLYQQFLHAVPAAWAVVGQVFGDEGLVRANIVFGAAALWAFFGLMRLWLPTPWATGATITLGASLPMVYYARSTFTEPAAMTLVVGGMWLFVVAARSGGSASHFRLAGAILGGVTLARIDGWMIGLALAAVSLTLAALNRQDELRHATAAWTGFLVVALIGMVDLVAFSLPYLTMHRSQLLGLVGASLVARIAAGPALQITRKFLTDALRQLYRSLPVVPVVAVIAGLMVLFLFRPFASVSYGFSYGLEGIEALEGLPSGTGRDYTEQASLWPAWYLGYPALATAVLWVVAMTRKRQWTLSEIALTWVGLVPSLVYAVAPSVNPDHPWAIRRFLPVVLPLVVGLAWKGLHIAAERTGTGDARALAAGGLAFILPTVLATAPLAAAADGAGSLALINEMCRAIDGRPTLILDTEQNVSTFFQEPVRRWCGVPVASVEVVDGRPMSPVQDGVVLLSVDRALVSSMTIDAVQITSNIPFVQETLVKLPSGMRQAHIEIFIGPVEPSSANGGGFTP